MQIITEEYFLQCRFHHCSQPDFPFTHDGSLNTKTIGELVCYFKEVGIPTDRDNEFWFCLQNGFVHMAPKYGGSGQRLPSYKNLATPKAMTTRQIAKLLKSNPVEFRAQTRKGTWLEHRITHGTHKAMAMIHRLVNDQPYIPFWELA